MKDTLKKEIGLQLHNIVDALKNQEDVFYVAQLSKTMETLCRLYEDENEKLKEQLKHHIMASKALQKQLDRISKSNKIEGYDRKKIAKVIDRAKELRNNDTDDLKWLEGQFGDLQYDIANTPMTKKQFQWLSTLEMEIYMKINKLKQTKNDYKKLQS